MRSLSKVLCLLLVTLFSLLVFTQAQDGGIQKSRFSHAELYYPSGKWDTLNEVSIIPINNHVCRS